MTTQSERRDESASPQASSSSDTKANSTHRTSSPTPRARVTYFDWLRGAATIGVVILHVFNKMLTDHSVAELGVPLVITWTELQLVFTRWAVPIFLMITGALLLDPNRKTSWAKIGRYVVRMLAVLAIFCPIYSCMSARTISLTAIIEGLHKAVTQDSWDHLWYVYALIGLYLLTPILAGYVRAATERMQRTTLLMLAVPTLIIPTFNFATGAHLVTFVWVTSSLFYYLLGAYAHQHLHLNGRISLLGLGALVIGMAGIAVLVTTQWRYPKWLIRPECPLVALWALFLFLVAKEHLDGKPAPAPLALTSNLSLAVYLLHPLPLIVLYRRLWWMPYQTLPPVIFEVVVLGIVLGVTIPAAAALKRVPGLNKVL